MINHSYLQSVTSPPFAFVFNVPSWVSYAMLQPRYTGSRVFLSLLFALTVIQAFSWYQRVANNTQSLSQKPVTSACASDSLSAYISYGSSGGDTVDGLYRTLVSCLNVRSLSLSISQGGCGVEDDPWSFNWRKRHRFPTLENLTISGYDWDSQQVSFRKGQRPVSTQAWKAAMDWSKLKRLDLSRPSASFLKAFHDELSSLQSLVLRPEKGFWGDEMTLCDFDEAGNKLRQDWISFIVALPPLHQLKISGMGKMPNITQILAAHGQTLRKLKIHDHERDCMYETGNSSWTRQAFDVAQIEELRLGASNLELLTIDVWRGVNGWPVSALNALSKFPKLSHLKLHFNLEDPWHNRLAEDYYLHQIPGLVEQHCLISELMQPLLNREAAKKIFQSLRRDQSSGRLRTLTLYAGDYGRTEGGGLRVPFQDDQNKPVRYDCWVEKHGLEVCNERKLYGHYEFGRAVDVQWWMVVDFEMVVLWVTLTLIKDNSFHIDELCFQNRLPTQLEGHTT